MRTTSTPPPFNLNPMAFPLGSPCSQEAKVLRGFTDLPLELLEMIYHQLDSIDDVHSLSRTYSTAYRAIEQRTVYTKVMRSIIGRSWQHRFDLQLCSVLDLHKEIVGHFEQGGRPLPVSAKHDLSYNNWEKKLMKVTEISECEYGPCAICIPDTAIYDILARYQGLRVLETMWLKRQLEEVDILTADATTQDEQFLRRYSDLLGRVRDFESGDIPARTPTEPATHHYTELNRDQRGRFYSAIVFVWILNELRWALTNFDQRSPNRRLVRILEQCAKDLTNRLHESVLDQLDQHAAFTFMYHHLLPKHSPALQDQNSSKLPFTFSTASLVNEKHCARHLRLFLLAGQAYLQPPDLIDLAVRHDLSRSAPYPPAEFSATALRWVRPNSSVSFPANVAIAEWKTSIVYLVNFHVYIIQRSSIPQAQRPVHHTAGHVFTASTTIKDLTSCYLSGATIAAIEAGEIYKYDRRRARDAFAQEWQRRGFWSIWWWANSEDKARAIIARWMDTPENLPAPQAQGS